MLNISFVVEDISIGWAMQYKCSQAISTEDDAGEVFECETLHLFLKTKQWPAASS